LYLKIENLISNDMRIEFFKSISYKYYVWVNGQEILKIPLVIILFFPKKLLKNTDFEKTSSSPD
jgi:hypothetical protein